MARDIVQVIDRMLEVLSEDGAPLRLLAEIASVRDKVPFTAPEVMGDRWWDLSEVFNTYASGTSDPKHWLPPDKVPTWAKRAGAILSGQAS